MMGVMVDFMSTWLNYSFQTLAYTHLVITVKGFLMRSTFKSVLWVKQIILHNVGGSHPLSQCPSEKKDWPTPKRREFYLKIFFSLEMHFSIKIHDIDFLSFHDGQQDSQNNFVNQVIQTVSNYLYAPRAQPRSQTSRVSWTPGCTGYTVPLFRHQVHQVQSG